MSKSYVIQIIGLASTGEKYPVATYFKAYDPDYQPAPTAANFDPDVCGIALMTTELSKAEVFDSFKDAHECYLTVSTRIPVRADGAPNRPLMAYSIAMVPVTIVTSAV